MNAIPILFILHMINGEKSRAPLPKSSGKKHKISNNIEPPLENGKVFLTPSFYENNIDPATGLKEPVDLLEMHMIYPETEEEKRYYLKTRPLVNIQFAKKPTSRPLIYDPRENYNRNQTKMEPLYLDLAALQAKNIDLPSEPAAPPVRYESKTPSKTENIERINGIFQPNTFMINPDDLVYRNWTTCDEFKRRSLFHPKDLLDIEWIPFYTWSVRDDSLSVIHKFSIPTKAVIAEYKQKFGPYLPRYVNWNQPKLLLEANFDLLLIAGDKRGMFYGIRHQTDTDYLKSHPELEYPVIQLRMKIVNPYLAMMYCEDYYATIMAINGQVPKTDEEKTEEAKLLNFTGTGYPVHLDTETAIRRAEWLKMEKDREEESKYIKITDDVPERNKYLERW
nr:unnamed protein product [Amyelois transitella]